MMDIKVWLSRFVNDLHVPVALSVLTVTTVFHFYTGKDLGSNYVDSLKAFYLFLAGHFGASQVWPDKVAPLPPPSSPPAAPTDPRVLS